jgi:hypothetical protein
MRQTVLPQTSAFLTWKMDHSSHSNQLEFWEKSGRDWCVLLNFRISRVPFNLNLGILSIKKLPSNNKNHLDASVKKVLVSLKKQMDNAGLFGVFGHFLGGDLQNLLSPSPNIIYDLINEGIQN